MREALLAYGHFVVFYITIVYAIYSVIMLLSITNIRKTIRRNRFTSYNRMAGSECVPPVSILVPSYNEELTIIESVRSLLALNYPQHEVIVINDGSKDRTLELLIDEFELGRLPQELAAGTGVLDTTPPRGIYYNPLVPNLYVIDKPNGGKADSLNVGINFSHYPLICTIDADSLLEKDSLIRIGRMYMENPEETVAIGGMVRIANSCTIENGVVKEVRLPRNWWARFQCIEYIRAFLGGRIGWSSINALVIISGAFGVFRKEEVIAVGGYREGYPGEDMNIVIKLHKRMIELGRPYRVDFCPDAVCWTQAPDTMRILASQRKRWGRGNLKNMWEYRHLLFNPKYRLFGMLSMPYTVIYEMLNPYVKLTGFLALVGYVLLDMTKWPVLVSFMLVNLMLALLFNCGSLLIEEMAFRRYTRKTDLLKMIGFAVLMTCGYTHLNAYWRLRGHIDFLRNNNTWGEMTRKSWTTEPVKSGTQPM